MATQSKSRSSKKTSSTPKKKKIYVLDTSVILYDHNAVRNFEENDVAIPITVLEELDNFKKGNESKNYEAREFIRILDGLSNNANLQNWVPINGKSSGKFKVIMNNFVEGATDTERIFSTKKADHLILNAALALQKEEKGEKVVLVTKDINLRLKAKSLNLPAEDYETGKIKDVDNLYSGKSQLNDIDADLITSLLDNGFTRYQELMQDAPPHNHYFILKNHTKSALAYYEPSEGFLSSIKKMEVMGVKPRNAEQAFAIHAILNPDVKLVTIQGVAGTGKTLLALAGSIEQRRNFQQIYLARPIVPLSNKDIGYLPGDVSSKIDPYMQPLWDNLKFIKDRFKQTDKKYKQIEDMVAKEKLLITPLAFIRGRTLSNIIFIVDEAQNLTPHEVKTIITRAGENSKIIFTGDIGQIDTPYLDKESNGLSYLIDRLKGDRLFAHVTLEKGERSELAALGNDLL